MSRVINFMLSDQPHLPNLVVALSTLRQHFDGEVWVYGFPQSIEIVKQVCADPVLDAKPLLWEPSWPGRNCQPIERIIMMNTPGPELRLYLDADVIVVGDPSPLFTMAEPKGMAFTQFCSWTCQQGIIQRRLKGLLEFPQLNQKHLARVIASNYPSVNCGVYACRPEHPSLPVWRDYTISARNSFIADETTNHILLSEFEGQYAIADGRYNASHKYYRGSVPPVILHCHGDSAWRPSKSPEAARQWWEVYDSCIEQNVGNIQNWKDSFHKSRWMRSCERELRKAPR